MRSPPPGVFSPERSLNQPKATRVCVPFDKPIKSFLFPFVCCFCFVRAFSFQGHMKIALNTCAPSASYWIYRGQHLSTNYITVPYTGERRRWKKGRGPGINIINLDRGCFGFCEVARRLGRFCVEFHLRPFWGEIQGAFPFNNSSGFKFRKFNVPNFHRPAPSHSAFDYCSCKQDAKERYCMGTGDNSFVKWKGTISYYRPKWADRSKLSIFKVGPKYSKPKFREFWAEWKAPETHFST